MKIIRKPALLVCSALILLLVCAGCELEVKTEVKDQQKQTRGDIEMIQLEDGTRCVIWRDYHKGGIDCDWKAN